MTRFLLGKVEKRKKKNPDDVDEVPVKACEFDTVAVGRQCSFSRLNP
jgi:hypothetical protein